MESTKSILKKRIYLAFVSSITFLWKCLFKMILNYLSFKVTSNWWLWGGLQLSGEKTEVSLEYLSLIVKFKKRIGTEKRSNARLQRAELGLTSWRPLFEVSESEWTVSSGVGLNLCSITETPWGSAFSSIIWECCFAESVLNTVNAHREPQPNDLMPSGYQPNDLKAFLLSARIK